MAHQPHPSGTSDGDYAPLSTLLLEELSQLLHGRIYARTDAEFKIKTTVFNGNVVTPAKAIVLPESASDVSTVLKFCTKHGLFPSIKAGGYGTAGWSINGDIVIDLGRLNGISIEAPRPDGSFISLKDEPLPNAKGKTRISETASNVSSNVDTNVPNPSTNPGKRQRSPEEDVSFESGLPRNQLVARFLRVGDAPSPAIRRRLDFDHPPLSNTPSTETSGTETDAQLSSGEEGAEGMSRQSSSGSAHTSVSTSTAHTTPSTAPTSPDAPFTDSESSVDSDPICNDNGAQSVAADVISSASAGIYGSAGATSRLRSSNEPEPQAGRHTRAEPPSPSSTPFSVRSNDPFGYMSGTSTPSASFSTIRPQRGFEQPEFPNASATARASASSSRVRLNNASSDNQSPFLDGAPTPSFLSATTTPVHANAFVSFGAGVKQKGIDLYTAANPLPATSTNGNVSSIPYHVPLAAHPVGSSVMLLGGFGFLSRLHGLSIDALVEVEMVLADGSIVFVNEKENTDLWWALRGAGPAFGVVTRYKAIAYPVPVVFAGNLIYNFHAATAASLIKHFRDCVKAAPRELYANVLLTAGPADKGSLIVVQLCYVGASEKGRAFLQAIASWDGEPCLLNEVSEKSFLNQQDSVAQILRGKAGRQWFIRSALITSLPDEVIHKTVNEFANTPVGCTWLFELAGGAVEDAEDTCLPKAQREAGFTIAAFHQWELDDDDPLCVTTAEDWIYNTLKPVSSGGPYPSFLGRHEQAQRVMACYGENWARLREMKQKYDPNGLFKNTFWPLDSEGNVREPCVHEPASPVLHPREL